MNGAANYTDFEMDQFKNSVFPRIIPGIGILLLFSNYFIRILYIFMLAGDYAFYVRNYETGTNRSILDIKVMVNVRATPRTVMDLSMLNMG